MPTQAGTGGRQHPGFVPDCFAQRILAILNQPGRKTRHHHQRPALAQFPGERHHMAFEAADDRQLLVGAMLEQIPFRPPRLKRPMDQEQLDPAILRRRQQFLEQLGQVTAGAGLQFLEQSAAPLEVHRPAVIGVHQAQIPQFRALVKVRQAGGGEFEQGLRQGVEDTVVLDLALERQEGLEKGVFLAGLQHSIGEREQGVLVLAIRFQPVGVDLGLAGRLDQIGFDPLDEGRVVGQIERVRAQQGLVQQIFIVVLGGQTPADAHLALQVDFLPPPNVLLPLGRHFRQHVQAGAHVLAAFGVVGRAGVHRVRPAGDSVLVEGVKLIEIDAELEGTRSHFVERQQAVVDVEHRVFHALGHQGSGELLQAHDEMQPLVLILGRHVLVELQTQKPLDEIQLVAEVGNIQAGLGNHLPDELLVGPTGAVPVDVGAIDGE